MAKKGSSNPADAARKAQKARELKKNKEARKAARESQTVKKDTGDIEGQIKHLKSQKLDDAGKKRLEALESELKYILKTKEAYVKAHPEARDRVFKQHRPQGRERDADAEGAADGQPADPHAHLYSEDGKLRDPKRSIYYDPIYNPYGVPPPGMPYKERTPEDESDESDESDEDDSDDDDIVMPQGPRPGQHAANGDDSDDGPDDSDDSDDIPLPPGPPPGKVPAPEVVSHPPPPPLPSGPRAPAFTPVPQNPPPSSSSWGWGDELAKMPQELQATPMAAHRNHPPSHPPAPPRTLPPPSAGLPARPPSSNQSITSASSTIVSQPTAGAPKTVDYTAGAIEAAPVIRDLRKEATVFVPRGVKRKQASAPGGVTVNSTPGAGEVDDEGDERRVRRIDDGGGLMGKLKGAGVLGQQPKKDHADDEYQKFLDGLGDMQ